MEEQTSVLEAPRSQSRRRTRTRFFLLLAGTLALALGLRLVQLDSRPMHNDEGVNALKFGQLWEKGSYKYDPNEHHGPTLYYATMALGRLTGAPDFEHYSDSRLRLVTVLFGAGLLLLLPLLRDALGYKGMLWAGLLTAVSPALVFYSRYYIHEVLLVFFTMLALASGWRYWRARRLGWALLAGAALGLMDATKETFPMTLAAAAIALGLNHTWNRLLDASGAPVRAQPLKVGHLAAALGVWVAVALLFFSSFFSNPSGPLDSLRSYVPWLGRAGGDTAHVHPWSFYLHRLLWFHSGSGPVWTEALILFLAIAGAAAGFRRRLLDDANASFTRFLALYAFLLGAFYSLLPYKTPWCLLSFWHATVLVAGVGAAVLVSAVRPLAGKTAVRILLLAAIGHLALQSWQQDSAYAADRRNPYVYAQTSPDMLNCVRKLESLAAVSPEGRRLLVKIITPDGDYWPLPWYLRSFRNTGWWDQMPADPYAPVMIVSARMRANLDDKGTHLMTGYFELRPRVFLELYVQKELWQSWLAKHPPASE